MNDTSSLRPVIAMKHKGQILTYFKLAITLPNVLLNADQILYAH